MQKELLADAKEKMHKTVEAVKHDLAAVRTGKASSHLLDSIRVEAYGSLMPLNQLATVSAPEPRMLTVQVFDKGTVNDVVRAIQKSDLGLNPSADGTVIRILLPALNEERRKELVRHCKHVAEEGRVAVRNIRRDANDHLKKALKDHKLSEDDEKHALNDVQKLTDEAVSEIDSLLSKKEKEVMEV